MSRPGSSPLPKEKPPFASAKDEESPRHRGGGRSRGGDSREVIGTNRSIRHTGSVRRVSAGEGASGGTGGPGAAAGSEATRGDGAVDSRGSQASSSDASDDSFRSRYTEYDSEDYRRRRSGRGTRRSRSPTSRRHREEYGRTSSFLNNVNARARNSLVTEHLAKSETEQVKSMLSSVSASHTSPPERAPVASSTMQSASGTTRQEQSLKPAPPTVNTRMNPKDLGTLKKFRGTDGGQSLIVNEPYGPM